jgi:hypothetical protein
MIAHIYPSVLQAVSGRGYTGNLDGCFQGYRGGDMQDLGYELPRIPIPRTWVNSGVRHPARATRRHLPFAVGGVCKERDRPQSARL